MSAPVFIVARTYMCAVGVARREGLEGPRAMSWLTSTRMHLIRGIETPTVWVSDCGRESLRDDDRSMIESRRATLIAVTCSEAPK